MLSRTGINWNNFTVLSTVGINWNDFGVLAKAGINWNDLGILSKAISANGYGDLVDRVARSWHDVKSVCKAEPELSDVVMLDDLAELMLKNAESLTEFLESSGLVASLHVLNVAGRQRMLSQRITKLCFMLAIRPDAGRLAQLAELTKTFQTAMVYLVDVPLSSPSIRENLQAAQKDWQHLYDVLKSISDIKALDQISEAGERLLNVSERLTDQYERAMQILIGDRMGSMA